MIEPEDVKRWQRELSAMMRAASHDPESFAQVTDLLLGADMNKDYAVAQLRQAGYSDSDIGRALGVTRQAVRQRYPHARP